MTKYKAALRLLDDRPTLAEQRAVNRARFRRAWDEATKRGNRTRDGFGAAMRRHGTQRRVINDQRQQRANWRNN